MSGKNWLFVIGAAICLLVANSAFWFSNNVFDPEEFTSIAAPALLSEGNRQIIASDIASKLLENKPVAERVLDDTLTKVIASILGSNLSEQIFTNTVQRLQTVITSPQRTEPVEMDLTRIKAVLNRVAIAVGETGSNIEQIPDTVTIAAPEKLPNIHGLGSTLAWLGPLSLIAAIILLIIPIYRSRKETGSLKLVLAWQSVVIFFAFILSLLIGPMFKPQLISNVDNQSMRLVLSNVYDAFIDAFNKQNWILFWMAVVFLIGFLIVHYKPKYRAE